MQAWIPGWQPYSGELDDWLARAFAGIESSLTELASDVSTQIYRWFGANIVNVPPYDAVSATGTITITVQDTAGYTIPAFTEMSFPDGSGQLQGFETTADVVIPSGSSSATGVFVQAMTPGSSGNGCSGSGALDTTSITFITGLTLAATTNNGNDAESDAAYLDRLTALFTTLTPTPITENDFTVIAGTQSGVGRAITLPTFNPGTWTISGTLNTTGGTANQVTVASTANIPVGAPISGTGVPAGAYVTGITSSTVFTMSANATIAGSETLTITGQLNAGGYVTSWVLDPNGAALSGPAMSAIQSTIQAECLAGVKYSVQAPTSNTVNVTANVVFWPGADATAGKTAVQNALTNALQPLNFGQNSNPVVSAGAPVSSWLNDPFVRVIVIEHIIMNVPGVHYVNGVQLNGSTADLALQGAVPITAPGTMTITTSNG
jgi:hypothetical protein